MQLEQIQKSVNQILGRNDGNRLTTEVSAGISMAIMHLINIVREEDQKAFEAGLQAIADSEKDNESATPATVAKAASRARRGQ